MPGSLLFLDFDGVICDSREECFYSSHLAYLDLYGLSRKKAVPLKQKDIFNQYRPFIRNGEDYVLIQKLIFEKKLISSQLEFDYELARISSSRLAEYKEAFYGQREWALIHDRDYWFSLNPPLAPLAPFLQSLAQNKDVFILSTKREDFIYETIFSWGIDWSSQRIFCSGKGSKQDFITKRIEEDASVFFIDDQIDHLVPVKDKRIKVFLPEWGYLRPGAAGKYADILLKVDQVKDFLLNEKFIPG